MIKGLEAASIAMAILLVACFVEIAIDRYRR